MSERTLRALVFAAAAANLALGLWLALGPRSFYDVIANFGPYNGHDLRDVSTWYLATGLALAVAAARTHWRVPLLVFATLASAAHAVNHLVDIDEADPGWVGPVDAASLGVATVFLGWLAWQAWRRPNAVE